MANTEVIAFHGWAFKADCWKPWMQEFGNRVNFKSQERGYFNDDTQSPVFSESTGTRILMVHSYGLHRCSADLFSQADLLIVFGGFLQFHPVAAQYRRRSKLMLTQMMQMMRQKPLKVLQDFYTNTFKPAAGGSIPEGEPDIDILIEDLRDLNHCEMEIAQMKKADKICILHGFEDGIVPRRKGRELYDHLHNRAQYFEIKNAGHALPFTHIEQCWSFLKPEIKELIY